jgi:hypothetical protein
VVSQTTSIPAFTLGGESAARESDHIAEDVGVGQINLYVSVGIHVSGRVLEECYSTKIGIVRPCQDASEAFGSDTRIKQHHAGWARGGITGWTLAKAPKQ